MVQKRVNRVELQGMMATVSPFISMTSASRLAMLSNHLQQAVSPKHSDIPRIMTGFESQLQAFNITMPVDAVVQSVHKRFNPTMGSHSVKESPYITIIYQDQDTGTYDCIHVHSYGSKHAAYGTKYIIQPIVRNIRPGTSIAAGTILALSPNVKEGGIFTNGVSANIANIALPCTIEDGFGVSESFCKRAALSIMQTYTLSWGKNAYPLNLYGTLTEFKAFPDIGDRIRPDGLVFAIREYNDMFNALEMTDTALMAIPTEHDTCVYGTPGALVYDVLVESGIGEAMTGKLINISPKMATQAERYVSHIRTYYESILESFHAIEKKDRNMRLSPALIQLLTRAYADTPNGKYSIPKGGKIRRQYGGIPLDEYRVEVKCTHEHRISMGSKLTGLHGNKGVVTAIYPDEWLPIDSAGNRAEIVAFAKSAVARLNPSQFYEQYIGAASRTLSNEIREQYNKVPFNVIWDRLISYYRVTSPDVYNQISKHYTEHSEKVKHIESIIESGIYLYIRSDNTHVNPGILKRIEAIVSPTYGPVTYRDLSGKLVTTVDKVFIGVGQFIILEKSDQHPMSVSSNPLQHHGLIAGVSKIARQGHPSKVQAVKVFSESEVRMYLAYVGRCTTSDLLAINNSPEAHKLVCKGIYEAEFPSRMPTIRGIRTETSRPLTYINHSLISFGLDIKWKEPVSYND